MLIPGLSFKTVRKFAKSFAFMYRRFTKEFKVYVFDRKREVPIGYTIKQMAEKLGCEIYMYEELEHSAYEEAPDFNRRVLEFLTKGDQEEVDA